MAVAFGAIAVAVSCEPAGADDPEKSEDQNTLWTSVPVSTAAGSQYLTVIASSDWSLSVIYPDSTEKWLTLSPMSGKAGTKKVAMSWTKNEADDSRECEIALSAGKYSDTLSFAQAGVKNVQHGKFGADMQVKIFNDGPVTFMLESRGGVGV